ncbi:MAG: recombination-associated protein RdgC [Thiolinea sp.]
MWFKNLYLYKLQGEFPFSAEALDEKLATKLFAPCGGEQRESSGWVAPLGKNAEALVHSTNGYILLTMAHQERMLPASVIKDELDERVTDIQERESRKVGGKEKKDLREQIEFELLPRAFTRTRKLDAWIDLNDQWLIINTSSPTQAERFTGQLRKTIDSLPVTTPETDISPVTLMTQWLSEGALPSPFELGEECELLSQDEAQSVAVFKKHELMAEEVQSNLANGKQVSKLQLIWDNKISFVLTEDMQIKRLKFLDIFDEQLDEHDPQSHAEKMDIEFSLMTGEVSRLLGNLSDCFKSQRE